MNKRHSKVPKNLIPCRSVNFKKRCIFVPIPKTGTTSIQTALKTQGKPLVPGGHLDILQIRNAIYSYYTARAFRRNTDFPTKASVPSSTSLRCKAKKAFNTFFKFAAVRNPWARAVSLYNRPEGVRVKHKMSFKAFCHNHYYASDTCAQPAVHRYQLDWLCDENGKCLMDYVYKLKNFNKAIKDIKDITKGRVNIVPKHLNRNKSYNSSKYRDYYNSETKALIAKRFEKDIDYFKFKF